MSSKDFDAWAKQAGFDAEVEDAQARKIISQLRSKLEEERRARKLVEQDLAIAEARAATALDLHEHAIVKLPKLKPLGRKAKAMNRGLPVLMCSDWHVEEIVDPVTINGRNKYDPDIARLRAEYLTVGAGWLVEQWAKSWRIDEMVVWYGGDLISGYIHEELVEANALSPTQATLLAVDLIAQQLEHLLRACKFLTRIHVYCSFGNHGRTTQKRKIQTAAENSYEWLAYHVLAQRYAKEQRLVFHIADGAHLYADLYGLKTRFHHGDDIRYNGGVGGLSIPLRKACDAWDEFEPADLTVFGHWHTFVDYGFAIGNGSLIGYNAYALSVKARWEPPRQGAFLIDEEWGKRLVTPIGVDPERKMK